jgi:hypothetical protein
MKRRPRVLPTHILQHQPSNQSQAWLQVEQAFRNWRSQRVGRQHLPEYLWKMACAVVETERLSPSVVCSRLKLNPRTLRRQLRRWPESGVRRPKRGKKGSNATEGLGVDGAQPVSFVPVPLSSVLAPDSADTLITNSNLIELQVRAGSHEWFEIRGEVSALRRLFMAGVTVAQRGRPCSR